MLEKKKVYVSESEGLPVRKPEKKGDYLVRFASFTGAWEFMTILLDECEKVFGRRPRARRTIGLSEINEMADLLETDIRLFVNDRLVIQIFKMDIILDSRVATVLHGRSCEFSQMAITLFCHEAEEAVLETIDRLDMPFAFWNDVEGRWEGYLSIYDKLDAIFDPDSFRLLYHYFMRNKDQL